MLAGAIVKLESDAKTIFGSCYRNPDEDATCCHQGDAVIRDTNYLQLTQRSEASTTILTCLMMQSSQVHSRVQSSKYNLRLGHEAYVWQPSGLLKATTTFSRQF